MAKTEQILDYTQINELADICLENSSIDVELYERYNVKRGLRDINGKGVLSGLTKISLIESSKEIDGKTVPCDGRLLYRGIDIRDLVSGFIRDKRPGFEETAYLLLFGKLPDREELKNFTRLLADSRTLPTNFTRDVIRMKSLQCRRMSILLA